MLQENPHSKGYSDLEQVAQSDLLELKMFMFVLWGLTTLCLICEFIYGIYDKRKFKPSGKLTNRKIRPCLNLYIGVTLIAFLSLYFVVNNIAYLVTTVPFKSG